MQITFLGGADEVGASCTLVEVAGKRILVDAGVRISPKAHMGLDGDQLPDLSLIERAGGLDLILLTHAHTDHTGALPLVVERYPDCPVLATGPTIALTRVLQGDARRIMQTRLDEEGELPLFDGVASDKLMRAFQPVQLNQRIPLGENLEATYFHAGHIAGAAMIGLASDEGRILFSGDISISQQRTVRGARPPAFRPDVLVLESTYGGRLHANRAVEEQRMADSIRAVVENGGKVLVPAFALGRAQEVVLIVNEFRRKGLLPDVPVFVDGMVRAICSAYKGLGTFLPLALRERIEAGKDPFLDDRTRAVTRADQRNALIWDPGPAVIVSSSGMLAGGPSPQYARGLAGDPRHAILLTGYQDEESPGRRLQAIAERGEGMLRLGKDSVKVRCKIGTYALSAHADESQLVNFTEVLDPSEVLLVHGDAAARDSLAGKLRERQRLTHLPRAGQTFAFRYAARTVGPKVTGLGRGQPLDLRRLWQALVIGGGGYFTVGELARAWWGEAGRATEMAAALEADRLYFARDSARLGLFRVRGEGQVARSEARRAALAGRSGWAGQLLVVRGLDGEPRAAWCERVDAEELWVVTAPDTAAEAIGPEQVVEALGPIDGLPAWLSPDAGEAAGVPPIAPDALGTPPAPDAARALATPASVDPLLAPDAIRPFVAPDAGRELDAVVTAAREAGLFADARWSDAPEPVRRLSVCLALLALGARRAADGYRLPASARSAGPMEPNAALAAVRAALAPDARLQKAGYRLDAREITLAFDFPDVAAPRFADAIAAAEAATGWQVVVQPEANQTALGTAVRELLPDGWRVTKGPSIYREEKRVAVTCERDADGADAIDAFRANYRALTGFELDVIGAGAGDTGSADAGAIAVAPGGAPIAPADVGVGVSASASDGPIEINAAYAAIRSALAGTTLYRVGLKGGVIELAFISPEVGRRYADAIAALSAQVGYPLAISRHPNQGAIAEVARRLAADAGWALLKAPGLHTGEAVVRLRPATAPSDESAADLSTAVEAATGYRLVVDAPSAGPIPPASAAAEPIRGRAHGVSGGDVIQIPLERIRLTVRQRQMVLDAAKTERAIERARRTGTLDAPIQVRRAGEGYVIVDGLRRFKVAEALGMAMIPAVVE